MMVVWSLQTTILICLMTKWPDFKKITNAVFYLVSLVFVGSMQDSLFFFFCGRRLKIFSVVLNELQLGVITRPKIILTWTKTNRAFNLIQEFDFMGYWLALCVRYILQLTVTNRRHLAWRTLYHLMLQIHKRR